MQPKLHRRRSGKAAGGFSLLELIIATTILLILSTMAVPMARLSIKREKERRLRADVWEMRDAIDRYKLDADRQAFNYEYFPK